MQALQRTLQTIVAQMRGLPSTARLLIGALMVILVMALFLVSLYAGSSSMASLGLASTLDPAARARAISYLETHGIPHEQRNGDLLVPAERKFTVLAQLTENNLVGADQINFDSLMADDSPFRTQAQNRQRYLVAKMNVLGSMIAQMHGIQRAMVVIDQPEGAPGLGKAHVPPSASVTVLPRDGELSQAQVDAIAQLVAGSHAGLRRQNVAIVDARTNRLLRARTDDTLHAGRYLEIKLEAERHVQATLERALDYIPNVRIAVNAQVDTTEVVRETSTVDEPKIGVVSETTVSSTSTGATPGGEPGVRSNTGASIASGSRSGAQSSSERSETETVPAFGKSESKIHDAKGYPLQINATIGVPKSYFVRMYQDAKDQPDAKPDEAALAAVVQAQIEQIKGYILPLIDTKAIEGAVAGTVAVSMIPDFGPAGFFSEAPLLAPADVSGGGGAGGLVSDGVVKYMGLGGLALVSLFMMLMMVRKAAVREELPSASELVGIPPALAAAESDLVGEADEASPALEGVELNDDAIRRQQMLEQITEMVSDTPDEAASLLRRWIKAEA